MRLDGALCHAVEKRNSHICQEAASIFAPAAVVIGPLIVFEGPNRKREMSSESFHRGLGFLLITWDQLEGGETLHHKD
jgi:hypothetical protein